MPTANSIPVELKNENSTSSLHPITDDYLVKYSGTDFPLQKNTTGMSIANVFSQIYQSFNNLNSYTHTSSKCKTVNILDENFNITQSSIDYNIDLNIDTTKYNYFCIVIPNNAVSMELYANKHYQCEDCNNGQIKIKRNASFNDVVSDNKQCSINIMTFCSEK